MKGVLILKEKYSKLKNNKTFLKILKLILCIFTGAFILTALESIACSIFMYCRSVLDITVEESSLLYELWEFVKLRYYKEAGAIRIAMALAFLAFMSVVLSIVYKRFFSKKTTVLTATAILPPALYFFTFYGVDFLYWEADITGNVNVLKIILVIEILFSIAHAIATGSSLIEDISEFDDCE